MLANGETANQPDLTNSIGSNLVKLSDGTPDPIARWGSVGIQSGAVAVVNDTEFRYGGGCGQRPRRDPPLAVGARVHHARRPAAHAAELRQRRAAAVLLSDPLFSPLAQLGTHAIITNNNFFDNFDTAMQIEPNGLLAADPTRPLASGNPFFRNNLMQRNDIDGMAVVTSRNFTVTPDETTVAPAAGEPPEQRRGQPDGQLGLGRHRPDLRAPGHDRPGRLLRQPHLQPRPPA